MVDSRFYKYLGSRTLKEIVDHIGGELVLPSNALSSESIIIKGVNRLDAADETEIAVLNNKKYLKNFLSTKAMACIIGTDINQKPENLCLIVHSNPYYAYSKLIHMFYDSIEPHALEISKLANVSENAVIGRNVSIGDYVVVEDGVEIGDGTIIGACTVVKQGVKIGARCKIGSNVCISHSIIGDNVVILNGAQIGQDGFGFATEKGVHYKVFHIGRVIIGNNVEIGANTTIDRGSISDTVIEDLCRLDNLVQIGHNVHLGKGSIVVAQAGIAGSTRIGQYCAFGGQVGVAGHLNIADQTQIAAQGGVAQDITEPKQILGGSPAVPVRDWHRQTVALKQLILRKDS